jgi:phosphoribosyl 1,2-cyclic phosphodiesterase
MPFEARACIVWFEAHVNAEERDESMNLTIWGCRGSLATPGAETLRYGGNTSCVEVDLNDGQTVVLDAGTGIRALGLELAERARGPIHLCLTHLHCDHIEGLPFFAPLWTPGVELHIWAPATPELEPAEAIARYMSPPLFPLELAEAPAKVTVHELPEDGWCVGPARITAEPVTHRGLTVGYRIEEGDSSLAYIPDHEPYRDAEAGLADPRWLSGYRLAERASVLIHDAQYFEHEYATRAGWGHSTAAHAVSFAQAAGVDRLVLFHHDPLHSDDALAALEAHARELWTGPGPLPILAREGMSQALSEGVPRPSAMAVGF